MRYIGETCDVCGETFVPTDDVVVCPECGTPVHRSCWAQAGACPHADAHPDFAWQATQQAEPAEAPKEAEEEDGITCPECGAACRKDALVCSECGNLLGRVRPADSNIQNVFMRGVHADAHEELDGLQVGQYASYCQINAEHYVNNFRKLSQGKKVTWNWAAFFFTPYWFFYRKMYKIGLAFLGLALVVSLFLTGPAQRFINIYEPVMQEVSAAVDAGTTDPTQVMTQYGDKLMAAQKESAPYLLQMALISGGAIVLRLIAAMFADKWYKDKIKKDYDTLDKMREQGQVEAPPDGGVIMVRRGGVSTFGFLLAVFLEEIIRAIIDSFVL